MKMLCRIAITFVLPTLAIWLGSAAAATGPETFDERFATFPKINGVKDVDWYSPLETAKGGPGPLLSPADTAHLSINAGALKQATDYVDKRGTVAFLIWQGGKLQWVHYGKGFDRGSRTDTASMHKSVMTILYGAALRDGLIKSIDEPAATYLPEWKGDARSKITIHNLMNMASGLDTAGVGMGRDSPSIQLLLSTDIVQAAMSHKAAKPPNTEFDYDNTNSEALGIILQRVTKMRYADYLSKTLIAPMGGDDAQVWLDRPEGMAHTFCCLHMTGEDWLRIGLLLKDRGAVGGHQVIPASWIDRMTVPSKLNPNYGLQLWLANPYAPQRGYSNHSPFKIPAHEPFLSKDMFFFDGWGAQRVYVSRAADLVIVRVGDATMDWDDSYLPNLIMRGMKTGVVK